MGISRLLYSISLPLGLAWSIMPGEALAGVRDVLDAASDVSSSDLSVMVQGDLTEVVVGDALGYTLNSNYGGHCYLIHVDARDRTTLLKPEGCEDAAGADGTVSAEFPAAGKLEADFPAGEDRVYGVLSPVPMASLEGLLGGGPHAFVTVADAETIASDLFRSASDQEIEMAAVAYDVLEKAPDTQYTTRGIIRRVQKGMEEPSESGEFASMDVQNIQFDFGSDELTEQSKKQLDVFGKALASGEIEGAKLKVAGHTDDVGDESYNAELSVRRASSVRRYLMAEFGLSPGMLDAVGYGESAPLMENDSETARAMNRRVEMIFTAAE